MLMLRNNHSMKLRLNPFKTRKTRFFLLTKYWEINLHVSYKSDHSVIVSKLHFQHGKGLWNNSLLFNNEYINCINNKIDDVILQYCLPVYNHENVLSLDKADVQFTINIIFGNIVNGNTW